MLSILTPLSLSTELVLLFVRIILGTVMLYYGYPKIKDLAANAKDFENMGFKPGILFGTLIAFLEFFGGIVILLGAYVWAIALLFGLEMIMGTIWKVTKTDKPFSDWVFDLLLLALCLIVLAFGPGAMALTF